MNTTKSHEHRWVAIRPGFPQKICKCGYMKVGTQTVLLSDFIRYTTPKAPAVAGDLGMAASGRPQFFQGGSVRDAASLSDITGGSSVLATALFSGGDFVIPMSGLTTFADVTDGAGFVEVAFDNTALGLSSVRVEVQAALNMTSPPGFNADNYAQLGFRIMPAAGTEILVGSFFGTSATVASETTRFPCHVVQATVGALAAGVNTIRLTAAANPSGGATPAILKSAAIPMRMTLLRP